MPYMEHRRSGIALSFVVGLALCTSFSAHAALVDDVLNFLNDRDRLSALRDDLAEDRASMSAHLDDPAALRLDVRQFFNDRQQVFLLRVEKALDRRAIKRTLEYEREELVRPDQPVGELGELAVLYLQYWDQWKALESVILNDLDLMRAAAESNDETTLAEVTTAFFDHHRERAQARLNWQAFLKAMRKVAEFSRIRPPRDRPTGTLSEITSEFLSDRAEWEALKVEVDDARESMRAMLEAPESLDDAIVAFLEKRRERRVKKLELDLDREAMRKKIQNQHDKRNPNEQIKDDRFSAKDIDKDDEDVALDEAAE